MARRRTRFALVHTECKRCGAPIVTGNRSLFGADALKARYGSICDACMPEAEQEQMLREMGNAVAGYLRTR